jgi:type I restriction enzyme S subunit
MTHYGMLLETKRRVSEAARSEVFRGDPAPAGTLLMSFKLTIGKVARLGIPGYHNEAIAAIHPTIADLDPYLFRLLPLFAMGGATNAAIMGNTLNATSLGNIPIALPPLAEQHRLVARVDLILGLLSDLEASLVDMSHTNAKIAQAIAASVNT